MIIDMNPTHPYPSTTRHPAGFHEVEPRVAHAFPSAVRIVDVRDPEEWAAEGGVPGAELVPLSTLPDAARGWDPRQALLLVCRSGGRSSAAAQHLVSRGFRSVYNLRGGMLAWTGCNLPVGR